MSQLGFLALIKIVALKMAAIRLWRLGGQVRGVMRRWRFSDRASDMWTTFSRVQENLIKGGLRGRNKSGRSMTTRAMTGINQNVKLNRALWVLAEEMRKLK